MRERGTGCEGKRDMIETSRGWKRETEGGGN